jgi:hypothetical protein
MSASRRGRGPVLKPQTAKCVIIRSDDDCDTRLVLLMRVANFGCAK